MLTGRNAMFFSLFKERKLFGWLYQETIQMLN
jgi:hypothetical protein